MTTQTKDHAVFYILRHLIDEPQVPILCIRCMINGCKRVKMSPFLRAQVHMVHVALSNLRNTNIAMSILSVKGPICIQCCLHLVCYNGICSILSIPEPCLEYPDKHKQTPCFNWIVPVGMGLVMGFKMGTYLCCMTNFKNGPVACPCC